MTSTGSKEGPKKLVYWRRELPPLGESIGGECMVEADSPPVALDAPHEHFWQECSAALESAAITRIEQELHRQGGCSAHVLDEQIQPKTDYSAGTTWLHGRYTYVMYRH